MKQNHKSETMICSAINAVIILIFTFFSFFVLAVLFILNLFGMINAGISGWVQGIAVANLLWFIVGMVGYPFLWICSNYNFIIYTFRCKKINKKMLILNIVITVFGFLYMGIIFSVKHILSITI